MTKRVLEEQARELHQLIGELIKKYQFRNRNEICCYGISVTQCYTLRALTERGKRTMKQLADSMHLTVSTMTRIVDQLVEKKLVSRFFDPDDRRFCLVELTKNGQALLEKIERDTLEIEKEILRRIKPEDRATLILTLRELIEAFDEWRSAVKAHPIQIRRLKHATKVKR